MAVTDVAPEVLAQRLFEQVESDKFRTKSGNTLAVRANGFEIQDPTDLTKIAKFDASGIATETERTITLPDVSGVLSLAAVAGGFNSGTILYTNKAAFAGADVETAQPIFEAAGDTATLAAATSYFMIAYVNITTAGTSAHTTSLLYGGDATLTSIGGVHMVSEPATAALDAVLAQEFAAATATAVTGSVSAATRVRVVTVGIVRVNAAGTFIPQYQYTGAPGAVSSVLANSFLLLQPFGSNTVQGLGVA